MRMEERIDAALAKKNFTPNNYKLNLHESIHEETERSRGYTLRMGPSDTSESYMKQMTLWNRK